MWLVGYLYNNNGMGTWCWEAAHALASAGEPVTLVCSGDVTLPGSTELPILRIDAKALPRGLGRFVAPGGMLSAQGPRVMRSAVEQLAGRGIGVSTVLLNSTELYDSAISAPQMVTAWARGVRLSDYLSRLQKFHARGMSMDTVRTTLGTLGWWRRDWFGYANANVVLAVTTPLAEELQSLGVRAQVLHPCTHGSAEPPLQREPIYPVRLLTAAVHLDEPRKRVPWMLDALREWNHPNCTLTLVGEPTPAVRAAADALPIPVEFTGSLSRDDVVRAMRQYDVFLFASLLDDWGYVVTEAMSQGLAVVAPRIAPFDEILGNTGALYSPDSATEFRHAIDSVIARIAESRFDSWARASAGFSRNAFVARLTAITNSVL